MSFEAPGRQPERTGQLVDFDQSSGSEVIESRECRRLVRHPEEVVVDFAQIHRVSVAAVTTQDFANIGTTWLSAQEGNQGAGIKNEVHLSSRLSSRRVS